LAFLVISLRFSLEAQYFGNQQIGFAGLEAGTLQAPGFYVTLPLNFLDHDISFYSPQGNPLKGSLQTSTCSRFPHLK